MSVYAAGTISVSTGSKVATFVGAVVSEINFRVGDTIVVDGEVLHGATVGELVGVDEIELVNVFTGTTGVGLPYVSTQNSPRWNQLGPLNALFAEQMRLIGEGILTKANYALRSELFADLVWPADALGKVFADLAVDEGVPRKGLYKKTGAVGAGAWVRIGDLPESDAAAADAAAAELAKFEAIGAKELAVIANNESQAARDGAVTALNNTIITANAVGPVVTKATKAAAVAALPLAPGAIVEVVVDESLNDLRTRYEVNGGGTGLVFQIYLDAADANGLGLATSNLNLRKNQLFPSENEIEGDRTTMSDGTTLTPTIRHAGWQALVAKAIITGATLVIPKSVQNFKIDNTISIRGSKGLRWVLDGILEATSANTGSGGQFQTCIKIGNQHARNWNRLGSPTPSSTAGLTFFTATGVLKGATSVLLDAGANRTTGVAVLQTGGLAICRSAANYDELAVGIERPDFLMIPRILNIDAGSGVISLDRAFDEDVAVCYIAMGTNNIAQDLQGEACFIADGFVLEGEGGLVSPGSPMQRTTFRDLSLNLRSLIGVTGFFGNGMAYSKLHFDRMEVGQKAADIAGNSHHTEFTCSDVEFTGAGGGVNTIVMNESARHCTIKIGRYRAPKLNSGDAIAVFNYASNCVIEIEDVQAPIVTGVPFRSNNPVATGSTLDFLQPKTRRNLLRVRQADLGSALTQFISADNAGAQQSEFVVDGGKFYGTPTTRAAKLEGSGNELRDVQFAGGSVQIDDAVVALTAYNNVIPGGFEFAGAQSMDKHDLFGNRSSSQKLLRAHRKTATPNDASSSTTANDPVYTETYEANCIIPKDKLTHKMAGTLAGTNGAKNLRVVDDTGQLATIATSSAIINGFVVTVDWEVVTNAIMVGLIRIEVDGVLVVSRRVRRTGLTLSASGRLVQFQRWVANASDTITTDTVEVEPKRYGFAI